MRASEHFGRSPRGDFVASAMKDGRSSEKSEGTFLTSQCCLDSADPDKSMSIAVVQSDSALESRSSVTDFWHQAFARLRHQKERRTILRRTTKERSSAKRSPEATAEPARERKPRRNRAPSRSLISVKRLFGAARPEWAGFCMCDRVRTPCGLALADPGAMSTSCRNQKRSQ